MQAEGTGGGPAKVTRKQLWTDLIRIIDLKRIGKQPNAMLVALWRQLKLEQRFQPLPTDGQWFAPWMGHQMEDQSSPWPSD